MDAERLALIEALVQQQNQNLLRLQQAVDRRKRERRKRDRVLWVRQWILRRPEYVQNASIPAKPMLATAKPMLKQRRLQRCTAKPTPDFVRSDECCRKSAPFLQFKERYSKVRIGYLFLGTHGYF